MRENFLRRLILWGCSTRVIVLLAVGVVMLYFALQVMSPNLTSNSTVLPIRLGPAIPPAQTFIANPTMVIVTAIANPYTATPTPTMMLLTTKAPPRDATRTPNP
jgi:hypothetical protein